MTHQSAGVKCTITKCTGKRDPEDAANVLPFVLHGGVWVHREDSAGFNLNRPCAIPRLLVYTLVSSTQNSWPYTFEIAHNRFQK